MNVYIYDSYVCHKKYQSRIAKIETRITDLGLNGKIIRLGVMSSVHNSIENEIRKGAKNIIIVGNNNLFAQTINSIAKLQANQKWIETIPLGFIPVGKNNNEIAEFLGIPYEEEACNVIAARRIKKLDLGMINEHYFLTQAIITTKDTIIEIDKNYSINITEPGEIMIINLPMGIELPNEIKSNAQDDTLELFIKTKNSKKLFLRKKIENKSVFSFKELQVINPKRPMIIDNSLKVNTPVNIKIAKEKINLIVGKGRDF